MNYNKARKVFCSNNERQAEQQNQTIARCYAAFGQLLSKRELSRTKEIEKDKRLLKSQVKKPHQCHHCQKQEELHQQEHELLSLQNNGKRSRAGAKQLCRSRIREQEDSPLRHIYCYGHGGRSRPTLTSSQEATMKAEKMSRVLSRYNSTIYGWAGMKVPEKSDQMNEFILKHSNGNVK